MHLCDMHADGVTEGRRYAITFPDGKTARPDLCDDHAAPLLAFAAINAGTARGAVVSIEDIEATKKRKPRRSPRK